MSISKVKPAGWSVGEKLTSGQISQLDTNTSYALDKRAGQTDTLESLVSLAAGGRVVAFVQSGTDADGTYQIGNGQVVRVLSLSASRNYTLSATGAVDGDLMSVEADPSVTQYVNVVDGASTATLTRVGYNGAAFAASFRFDGTNWKLVSFVPSGLYADVFTANGTWTRPSFVGRVLLLGVGGGGGGGGGGGHGLGDVGGGGGGGGGARVGVVSAVVSADQAVTVGSAGATGAGGVPGNNGGDGGDGGDTTFGGVTFKGAQGGCGGAYGGNASFHAPGGGPVRGGGYINPRRATAPTDLPLPNFGGWGTSTGTSVLLRTGASSPLSTGAAPGADSGGAPGGAGGGASDYPGSVPGAGGASSTGSGIAGSAGSAGTLGAGGGGGGGAWTVGGAPGGAGGAGGAGALIVIYAR